MKNIIKIIIALAMTLVCLSAIQDFIMYFHSPKELKPVPQKAAIAAPENPHALPLPVREKDSITFRDSGQSSIFTISVPNYHTITIACGNGTAIIDTQANAVTYDNCIPEESAKIFYKLIAKQYQDDCHGK